jgi:putative ABC transport system substrate-binding protein
MADRLTRQRALLGAIAASLVPMSPMAVAQATERIAHVGLLCSVRCDGAGFDSLRDGLRSVGWIEGSNLQIEYRAAGGQTDRLPALMQELAGRRPDVIFTSGPQPAVVAKNATSTIPIVFVGIADPVRIGLVQSLARPGGNVTGLATVVPGGFIGKQLEVLKQLLPKATRIAVLINPSNEITRALFPLEGPAAAQQLGLQLQMLEVRAPEGIESAIEAAVQEKADALWVLGDPIFHNPSQRIPDLAARAKLPALYITAELVNVGGLVSYGPDFMELFRRAGVYVDKILKGAKPAELPVEQPTKFQLVINLKTAKALGITIPQSLLQRADEVIQ